MSWLLMALSQCVTAVQKKLQPTVWWNTSTPCTIGHWCFLIFYCTFCRKDRKTGIVTSCGKIVVMVNYGAEEKKWIISKTTLTFCWTLWHVHVNGNATLNTSKEIAIIFDKINCYRGDLLVWESQTVHFCQICSASLHCSLVREKFHKNILLLKKFKKVISFPLTVP